ncbi:hypothetical protein [Pyrococcus kukulkanii]|uniref:hypothetical protein n=1 Tax=Pyrococcus kukulkanii TaxID=1609559 RepID=UPI0035669619
MMLPDGTVCCEGFRKGRIFFEDEVPEEVLNVLISRGAVEEVGKKKEKQKVTLLQFLRQ